MNTDMYLLFIRKICGSVFLENLRLATRIGLRLIAARRCGRVAEGGGLLNR